METAALETEGKGKLTAKNLEGTLKNDNPGLGGIVKNEMKSWAVSSYAFAPIFTAMNVPTDLWIQGMDNWECFMTRMTSLPLLGLAGPIMKCKDIYRKKLWGINPKSSNARRIASNLGFSLLMQGFFYVTPLVMRGHTDLKQLGTGVAINMATRVALHNLLTFPYLNAVRDEYGVLPENERREKSLEEVQRTNFMAKTGRALRSSIVYSGGSFPYFGLKPKPEDTAEFYLARNKS